ncbi:MAG: hypothetical protein KGH98_00260 [Candidatus Micrarchaeota archaeon]|nr:hypothetical protein [Candidatus Micrarchaeota archaeon]
MMVSTRKATLADVAIAGKTAPKLTTDIAGIFAWDNRPRSVFEIARALKTKDLDAIMNVISRLEHEYGILEKMPNDESHVRKLRNGVVRISPRYRIVEDHIGDMRDVVALRSGSYFETTY